jgi:choline dehydrogenase-like flavoprotein
MKEEVRGYKAPPSLALTEDWNYDDNKDFHGGYIFMSVGPLPQEYAGVLTGSRGLWGEKLRQAMMQYNHQIGFKMVGEMLPVESNCVTLTDERDQYGLPIPRITYTYTDNDKRLIGHALEQMELCLRAAGADDVFRQEDDTNHLNGTVRMGDDPERSVVDADCRSWDIRNLWICDGSVFPTVGGVNPSLTIQALALRTADRIREMAARGEL